MIAAQAVVEQADTQTAYALLESLVSTIATTSEVMEASPQKVTFQVTQCPIYQAAVAVGMDPAQIEASCRSGAIRFMDGATKQLNPDLSYTLEAFRSGPQGGCIEQIGFD